VPWGIEGAARGYLRRAFSCNMADINAKLLINKFFSEVMPENVEFDILRH
jgi:hypothetical protein